MPSNGLNGVQLEFKGCRGCRGIRVVSGRVGEGLGKRMTQMGEGLAKMMTQGFYIAAACIFRYLNTDFLHYRSFKITVNDLFIKNIQSQCGVKLV